MAIRWLQYNVLTSSPKVPYIFARCQPHLDFFNRF